MDKTKRTLFDQSYSDFQEIYFSDEMTSFIRDAYKLKRRCARLFMVMFSLGLIFTGLFVYVWYSTSFISSGWLIEGAIFAFAMGAATGSLSDPKITVVSYRKFYAATLSGMYSHLLNMNISLQTNNIYLYQDSPFRVKKKIEINTRNQGFSLSYQSLRAQMYVDTATRKRFIQVILRYILIYGCVIAGISFSLQKLGKYIPFTKWLLALDWSDPLGRFLIILYFATAIFIVIWPFVMFFYKAMRGLTSSYLSVCGVRSITMQNAVIWIKRRTNSLYPANQLRFNRIDLNEAFYVSLQVADGNNQTAKMLEAKTILNPLIEDLLSYINKKYMHLDLAISENRIDIQFLDDIMVRKKDKVINQLMNPVLFGNKDLYISNMYHFYEIVELIKLISKYFYCNQDVELVTAEERALLERSAQLEKIPVSHFKRDNKQYLAKILRGN